MFFSVSFEIVRNSRTHFAPEHRDTAVVVFVQDLLEPLGLVGAHFDAEQGHLRALRQRRRCVRNTHGKQQRQRNDANHDYSEIDDGSNPA
jgi:hypothetical protein